MLDPFYLPLTSDLDHWYTMMFQYFGPLDGLWIDFCEAYGWLPQSPWSVQVWWN